MEKNMEKNMKQNIDNLDISTISSFSLEQEKALQIFQNGDNLFITGPGGSGKTHLIREMYKHSLYADKQIYVTALTGCAAVLLNCKATTLHSWAGIGLGTSSNEDLLLKIRKNKQTLSRWKLVNILVIDECSMLSQQLFEKIDWLAKKIRNQPSAPFGGIQLIMSGDFYQLPPIGNRIDPETSAFCFESTWWTTYFSETTIVLQHIFRQTDQEYIQILQQIREGRIRKKDYEFLMNYVNRPYDATLLIEPTRLYPIKSKVMQLNADKLTGLPGEVHEFTLLHIKNMDMTVKERQLRQRFTENEVERELTTLSTNLICENLITLKVGAQVMCIINIKSNVNEMDMLLCNGSQGIVTHFCPLSGAPVVKFLNGVVRTMVPYTWTSEIIPGIGVSQVPLILAWGLTIHKCQGATLEVAEIDVGSNIFEVGQTYVALSRIKGLQGLYLSSFDMTKIQINSKVREYYDNIGILGKK